MRIYDFVEWELAKFRAECNFSDEELEHLMREASSEQERENIRKAIEQLDR